MLSLPLCSLFQSENIYVIWFAESLLPYPHNQLCIFQFIQETLNCQTGIFFLKSNIFYQVKTIDIPFWQIISIFPSIILYASPKSLVERIQSLCGKSYLKLIHFVCPMIYYRMFVDFGNILIYPFFQFLFGIDTDALQTLLPHLSKETFNQVQP